MTAVNTSSGLQKKNAARRNILMRAYPKQARLTDAAKK